MMKSTAVIIFQWSILCLLLLSSWSGTAFAPPNTIARCCKQLRQGVLHQKQKDAVVVPQSPPPPTTTTTTGSFILSFHQRNSKSSLYYAEQTETETTNTSEDTVERPDPSILLSAKGESTQRFGFIAISLSLAIGTYLAVDLLGLVEWILPNNWFALWRDFTWPVPLGLIFVAAGSAHFLQKEAFKAMVPPMGTWGGLWQVRFCLSKDVIVRYTHDMTCPVL